MSKKIKIKGIEFSMEDFKELTKEQLEECRKLINETRQDIKKETRNKGFGR